MDNHIPSGELLEYAIELEIFESTTLTELVIKKAEQAGFIIRDDSITNLSRIAWIKKVTQHAEDAFKLEAVADGEALKVTIANFKQFKAQRDKQIIEIIELLAKQVIGAIPPYGE